MPGLLQIHWEILLVSVSTFFKLKTSMIMWQFMTEIQLIIVWSFHFQVLGFLHLSAVQPIKFWLLLPVMHLWTIKALELISLLQVTRSFKKKNFFIQFFSVCNTVLCPSSCSNHGTCVNGSCICDPGFAGISCSGSNYVKLFILILIVFNLTRYYWDTNFCQWTNYRRVTGLGMEAVLFWY